MSILLFKRLWAWGHQHHNLKQIFTTTLQKLNSQLNSQHNISVPHHNHLSHKPRTPEKRNHNNSLFFHLQYHPKGISRRTIQQTYQNCCNSTSDDTPDTTYENNSLLSSNTNSNTSSFESLHNQETGGVMTIDNLTVAYSRPKNLRDLLCPSTLLEFPNTSVKEISAQLQECPKSR